MGKKLEKKIKEASLDTTEDTAKQLGEVSLDDILDMEFDNWNEIKKSLQRRKNKPYFSEREVWWYSAGQNLGAEINGKNARFSRPVLIIRRYGSGSFFGVPLSTQSHTGRWYAPITTGGIGGTVLLSQASSYSAYRLLGRMDKISIEEFQVICEQLRKLIFKE